MTPRGQYTRGSRIAGPARDNLGADLKRQYEKGTSIRALAEGIGRSYGFVHRLLSETGVQLRGRGGANRNRTSNRTTHPASPLA
jgi:hypothetical protein